MILMSIKPDPNRSDKVIFEFADYGSGIEADSEDSLRGNLNNVDVITLLDDIAINSPIAISGQKPVLSIQTDIRFRLTRTREEVSLSSQAAPRLS